MLKGTVQLWVPLVAWIQKEDSFCWCALLHNLNLLNQQFKFDSFQSQYEAVFETR